jgi:hypothetical protein
MSPMVSVPTRPTLSHLLNHWLLGNQFILQVKDSTGALAETCEGSATTEILALTFFHCSILRDFGG